MTKLPLIKFPETPWFEETENIYHVLEMKNDTWLFLYQGEIKCVVATLTSDKLIIRGAVNSDDLHDGLVDVVLALRDEQIEGRRTSNENVVETNRKRAILSQYDRLLQDRDLIEYEGIHKRWDKVYKDKRH